MKLEKIAQILDIVSNSNNLDTKNLNSSSTASDGLSYNLVAGILVLKLIRFYLIFFLYFISFVQNQIYFL